MTGFFFKINKNDIPIDEKRLRDHAHKCMHRGGYLTETIVNNKFFLKSFINAPQNKNSKIFYQDQNDKMYVCVIDGVIFNIDNIQKDNNFSTKLSAGNSFIQLYKRNGCKFFNDLEGLFSGIIIMENKEDDYEIVAFKDKIGLNPLYIVESEEELIITSELKSIPPAFSAKNNITILEPGSVYTHKNHVSRYEKYFEHESLGNIEVDQNLNVEQFKSQIYKFLDDAVKKNIDSKSKVSALLSGGIDSTVICALAQKYIPNMDVYTVYFKDSPDLIHAQSFDRLYPNVKHHYYEITIDDIEKIIPNVIYALETFDAALIRSAIPMYFLCSKIDSDTKILLTGEGADELFGGYNYLTTLTDSELKKELINMLKIEHATGLQRVDRIPYAFGIEARAPWFDINLVRYSFLIPNEMKIKKIKNDFSKKWIIKETFKDIIPESVYTRKKAKFSEGVGTQFLWRNKCNEIISDEEFEKEKEIYPNIFLKNKEELYYWRIFNNKFTPNESFIRELPRTATFEI